MIQSWNFLPLMVKGTSYSRDWRFLCRVFFPLVHHIAPVSPSMSRSFLKSNASLVFPQPLNFTLSICRLLCLPISLSYLLSFPFFIWQDLPEPFGESVREDLEGVALRLGPFTPSCYSPHGRLTFASTSTQDHRILS